MSETDLFRALSDPTRRAVFERLAEAELSVSALKAGFAISQPAISQHLSVLKQAGLVSERREGRNVHYRAAPEGLTPLLDWVGRYEKFWPGRLERLKSLIAEMDQ